MIRSRGMSRSDVRSENWMGYPGHRRRTGLCCSCLYDKICLGPKCAMYTKIKWRGKKHMSKMSSLNGDLRLLNESSKPFSCMLAESFSSSTLCNLSTSLLTTPITLALAEWSTPVVSNTAETETTNSEICGPSSTPGPVGWLLLLLILVLVLLGPEEGGLGASSDLLFLSNASSTQIKKK